MRGALGRIGGRAIAGFCRALGSYRTWRLLHAAHEADPREMKKAAEFAFNAELPGRFLGDEFLTAWADDALTTKTVRRHCAQLDSPFYAFLMFQQIRQRCLDHGHIAKRVLEIGPGVQVGPLFCFAASGCEKVAGIDVAPMKPNPAFYQLLKDYLGAVSGFGWWRYTAAMNKWPALTYPGMWENTDWKVIFDRISYHSPAPSHAIPFDAASFDLVYSVTAFEHFPEPEKTVDEIWRVLEPGGITVHEIDMRHHMDMRHHEPKEALTFLTWSDGHHAQVSEQYGEGRNLEGLLEGKWGKEVYGNRLRLSDFRALFEKKGFEILKVEELEVLAESEIDRNSFVEPYRAKPLKDLAVLVARITARKPKA